MRRRRGDDECAIAAATGDSQQLGMQTNPHRHDQTLVEPSIQVGHLIAELPHQDLIEEHGVSPQAIEQWLRQHLQRGVDDRLGEGVTFMLTKYSGTFQAVAGAQLSLEYFLST